VRTANSKPKGDPDVKEPAANKQRLSANDHQLDQWLNSPTRRGRGTQAAALFCSMVQTAQVSKARDQEG